MKPEYEIFKQRGRGVTSTFRLSPGMRRELDIYVEVEGDSLSSILLEGAARVIQDRRNDPEYLANLSPEARAKLIATTQEQLDTMGPVVNRVDQARAFMARISDPSE
ncbi:hypothetical protein BH23PAT1_BH23PAT1_4090 [soil metagenome]